MQGNSNEILKSFSTITIKEKFWLEQNYNESLKNYQLNESNK